MPDVYRFFFPHNSLEKINPNLIFVNNIYKIYLIDKQINL